VAESSLGAPEVAGFECYREIPLPLPPCRPSAHLAAPKCTPRVNQSAAKFERRSYIMLAGDGSKLLPFPGGGGFDLSFALLSAARENFAAESRGKP